MSQERDQAYFDIFTTALEGGVGYWSLAEGYHIWKNPEATDWKDLVEDLDGFEVVLIPHDDPESPRLVNRDTIARGVGLFTKEKWTGEYAARAARNLRSGRWDDLDIDSDLADRIVQFGIFGKLVYG